MSYNQWNFLIHTKYAISKVFIGDLLKMAQHCDPSNDTCKYFNSSTLRHGIALALALQLNAKIRSMCGKMASLDFTEKRSSYPINGAYSV